MTRIINGKYKNRENRKDKVAFCLIAYHIMYVRNTETVRDTETERNTDTN